MAARPIVKVPHNILGRVAREVLPAEIKSPKIQRLISEMKETLRVSTDGVGLAAPQVGESLKIFLISGEAKFIDAESGGVKRPAEKPQISEKKNWEHFVFINPVLVRHSRKKTEIHEGCLSLPGKFGLVARYEKVELSWLDEEGRKHTRGFTNFFARVVQHELDHLDGKLIADRAKKLFEVKNGNG